MDLTTFSCIGRSLNVVSYIKLWLSDIISEGYIAESLTDLMDISAIFALGAAQALKEFPLNWWNKFQVCIYHYNFNIFERNR
jgi:hypothetical protein